MAHKICDKKPCDELMHALKSYMHALPPTNPEAGFVAIRAESKFSLTKNKAYEERIDIVALRYCPFCGTRIGYGMTEWITPPHKDSGVKIRKL